MVKSMKDRCVLRFLLVLVFVTIWVAASLAFIKKTAETFTTQQVAPMHLDEVKLLMRYHGARIARYENGKWYFLSSHGRWLPLKTEAACRYLASVSSKNSADASCLF